MEQFKKDLITTGRPSFIPALILGIIAIISAVTGIAFEFSRYDNFDPTQKGLAQLNAIYLMGPFAEETTNGKVTARYYIAEDINGYLCVISTNKNTCVPVYGQDFTDGNDIYSFTPQTLKGNRVKISEKLASYLVKYFKDSGLGITTSNYTDYFGSYYLDTDYNRHQLSIVFYIGSGILAFAAIMLFISGNRNGAFIKQKMAQLEADGSLNALYENFATNKHFFSNKLKLAVSPDYIIDLNRTTNGFNVIPLDTITNVYVCNIADGKLTGTNYIALEVEFGNRITIAPHDGELTEYNYVVNNIRHFIKERHGEADA